MWRFGLVFLVILAGCGGAKETSLPDGKSSGSSGTSSADPVEVGYEQVRAGSFQYGAVVDTLGEAIERCLKVLDTAKGPAKEATEDIRDALDSAGAAIEAFQEAPADKATYEKNFKAEDEKRLKAINGGNDALHLLGEAREIMSSYEQDLGKPVDKELADLIQLAIDDLSEAIVTFGGKVETEESVPVP